jgi:2-keto-3-deoxy-L-rhamnonate aldolase RhmA
VRRSRTLARIHAGQVARICGLGNFVPPFVKHAAHFGFDCIWLDAEHNAWCDRDLRALMPLFHHCDIDCMLRPPTLEKARLYRYLEDGAAGLLIPHVATPEKARMLVDAVKFPPLGDRGQDGAGLDADFYVHGTNGYPEAANRETFLVVQIESPQAVENLDAIAAVEGVDGLFIGPGDLGLRISRLNSALTLDEARQRVAEAAARHGKAWGQPASSAEHVRALADQGAQLIAWGGEFMAYFQMLDHWAQDFARVLGKEDRS